MTKTSFDGTNPPVDIRRRLTTTGGIKLLLRGQFTRENCSRKAVDIPGGAGNVLWDSLGEAGERPALPRNCETSATMLVESGDRANRWSRKNLRGRGRLQELFQ